MILNVHSEGDVSHGIACCSCLPVQGDSAYTPDRNPNGNVMAHANPTPRFCVWCGAKVANDSRRELCAGHQRLASVIDDRIRRRLDRSETPASVPIVRDTDDEHPA